MWLQKQIQEIQTKIANLPGGKLLCCRNENRYKWYVSDGHQSTYIPKSNRTLAEQLALKKYLTISLEELSREAYALDCYLKHCRSTRNAAEQFLKESCGYAELLSNLVTPLSQELSDWATSAYEHNPNFQEQLIHRTTSGNFVRSKSEAIISMFLHTNRIPYRYECALSLGEVTLYPDFTIRHPHTGQYYYWEHFGRMDDPVYYKNVYSKLQIYTSHGIVPSIQLITTYETKDNPLDSEVIEKIVEHFFL